jgi:hypothetical protein
METQKKLSDAIDIIVEKILKNKKSAKIKYQQRKIIKSSMIQFCPVSQQTDYKKVNTL